MNFEFFKEQTYFSKVDEKKAAKGVEKCSTDLIRHECIISIGGMASAFKPLNVGKR